jgi:hypothetical protein
MSLSRGLGYELDGFDPFGSAVNWCLPKGNARGELSCFRSVARVINHRKRVLWRLGVRVVNDTE